MQTRLPIRMWSNMDLVLSKLGKDALTVFTLFQNKCLKATNRKPHLLERSDNIQYVTVGGSTQ